MCAQLCGIGHANMRGVVVVEPAAAFEAWLRAQPTFAATQAGAGRLPAPAGGGDLVEIGRTLAQVKGCVACHSIDGAPGVGPTWKGLFGRTETLADGSTAADRRCRTDARDHRPGCARDQGLPPIMPKPDLNADEVDALAAYIKAQ